MQSYRAFMSMPGTASTISAKGLSTGYLKVARG